MELLSDTKKAAGGTGLKRTVGSLVLDILTGRCLLDTHAEVASRWSQMWGLTLGRRSRLELWIWGFSEEREYLKVQGSEAITQEMSVGREEFWQLNPGGNLIFRVSENEEESKRHWEGTGRRRKPGLWEILETKWRKCFKEKRVISYAKCCLQIKAYED